MNEQINQKQNNNILQIVIIILLVVLIAIGGMILLKDNKKDNSGTDNNISENENTNTNNNNNQNSSATDFDLSKFDGKKCLNATNDQSVYTLQEDNDESKIGLSISLNNEKDSAIITIDWSKYFEVYGISVTDGVIRNYTVTNFTKKIKNVYLSGFGQASGYETAFYVMEDGTVEYTPISKGLGDNGSSADTILKSFGQIPGVSGVVKLAAAFEDYPWLVGGGMSIIGIKADGTFYDLSKIIYTSDNY